MIVITANGSINRAVQAMRGGAFDFPGQTIRRPPPVERGSKTPIRSLEV